MQTTHERIRFLKVSEYQPNLSPFLSIPSFPVPALPATLCPSISPLTSLSPLNQPTMPTDPRLFPQPHTVPFPLSTALFILLSPDLSASIPASRPATLENQPRLFSSPSPVPFISFDQNRSHLHSLCHFPSSATILSLTDP